MTEMMPAYHQLLEMLVKNHLRLNRHLLARSAPCHRSGWGGSRDGEVMPLVRCYGPAKDVKGRKAPLP